MPHDDVQEELDKPEPIESHVFVLDPASFVQYCAQVIGRFHADLCDEGYILKADSHRVRIPSQLELRAVAPWTIRLGENVNFLFTRRLFDKREEVELYLAATKGVVLTFLQKHEARYLGGMLVYPGLAVGCLRFDVALVLPFWTEKQG